MLQYSSSIASRLLLFLLFLMCLLQNRVKRSTHLLPLCWNTQAKLKEYISTSSHFESRTLVLGKWNFIKSSKLCTKCQLRAVGGQVLTSENTRGNKTEGKKQACKWYNKWWCKGNKRRPGPLHHQTNLAVIMVVSGQLGHSRPHSILRNRASKPGCCRGRNSHLRQTLRMQVYALVWWHWVHFTELGHSKGEIELITHIQKSQMNHSKEISLSSEKKIIFSGQLRWQAHHRQIQMTAVSAFHL